MFDCWLRSQAAEFKSQLCPHQLGGVGQSLLPSVSFLMCKTGVTTVPKAEGSSED